MYVVSSLAIQAVITSRISCREDFIIVWICELISVISHLIDFSKSLTKTKVGKHSLVHSVHKYMHGPVLQQSLCDIYLKTINPLAVIQEGWLAHWPHCWRSLLRLVLNFNAHCVSIDNHPKVPRSLFTIIRWILPLLKEAIILLEIIEIFKKCWWGVEMVQWSMCQNTNIFSKQF